MRARYAGETCGAGLVLEAAAGASRHGRASKERGLEPGERPSIGRRPTISRAARRAQAASFRTAPPPRRQRAQARLRRARHAALACRWRPQLARRTTAARRRRHASRRHGGLLREVPSEHNQRAATARARSKLACCASSPETESAGAPALSDTRAGFCVEDRSSHVAPRARAEGARPLADVTPFYRVVMTRTSAASRVRVASSSAAPPF